MGRLDSSELSSGIAPFSWLLGPCLKLFYLQSLMHLPCPDERGQFLYPAFPRVTFFLPCELVHKYVFVHRMVLRLKPR